MFWSGRVKLLAQCTQNLNWKSWLKKIIWHPRCNMVVHSEAAIQRCPLKKEIHEKKLWPIIFLINCRLCSLIKKETPTQVFSCEFTKFLSTAFFNTTPPVADSIFYIFSYVPWNRQERHESPWDSQTSQLGRIAYREILIMLAFRMRTL